MQEEIMKIEPMMFKNYRIPDDILGIDRNSKDFWKHIKTNTRNDKRFGKKRKKNR